MADVADVADFAALAGVRTLRSGLSAAYATLGKSRSFSHILPIAEQLFAGHPLTIASVSRIFGISRLVGRKHLVWLEAEGLAEAMGRRKTGIVDVARDGLTTFCQASTSPAPKRLPGLQSRPASLCRLRNGPGWTPWPTTWLAGYGSRSFAGAVSRG
jgi:hypothetical protein